MIESCFFVIYQVIRVLFSCYSSSSVIQWASEAFSNAVFVCYEQVNISLIHTHMLYCMSSTCIFCDKLTLAFNDVSSY